MTKTHEPNPRIFRSLKLALEISGTTLSADAMTVMVLKLSSYPEAEVLTAIDRCTEEVKGRLTLADIIGRIPDRWPSAEEAWAQIAPVGNEDSVVAPREAIMALGEIYALKAADLVAARMAFRDSYQRHVQAAKDRGEREPAWSVSVGSRKDNLEAVLLRAMDAGQISLSNALRHIDGEAADRLRFADARQKPLAKMQPQPIRGFLSEPADVTRWRAWCVAWGKITERYAEQVREESAAKLAELLQGLGSGPRAPQPPPIDWKAEEARLAALHPAPEDIDDLPFDPNGKKRGGK